MYLEDALLTVLWGEICAGIKSIVNTHLFKGVKYYHNSQSDTCCQICIGKIDKGGLQNKQNRLIVLSLGGVVDARNTHTVVVKNKLGWMEVMCHVLSVH